MAKEISLPDKWNPETLQIVVCANGNIEVEVTEVIQGGQPG